MLGVSECAGQPKHLLHCAIFLDGIGGLTVRSPVELAEGQDAVQWMQTQSIRPDACLCFSVVHHQYYLPGKPTLKLNALLGLKDGLPHNITVFAAGEQGAGVWPESRAALVRWCEERQLACVSLDRPLQLNPIAIPKPWGRELWYTGIEARGQSGVSDGQGRQIPLPWLLAFLPEWMGTGWMGTGHPHALTLLKILDPLPEPVFGDLYFEMHEQKQEVYVVTKVDPTAWPDGVGGIRFGFCQNKRSAFSDDAAFKQAYLHAVSAYRAARDAIDKALDRLRALAGIGLHEPVAADQMKRWLATLPSELRDQEQSLRASLDSFAAVLPLRVGDVVKVPCRTPHSLLHGVTTVEFQTPVYERKILSFAQKVLTQDHWDTEAAMATVNLDAPDNTPLPRLPAQDGCCREQVVVFDDFSVERWRLATGADVTLPAGNHYLLVMAITEGVRVNGAILPAGKALLVPAACEAIRLAQSGSEEAVALLSFPKATQ